MNRLMQWVIAAALICSSTIFTSCTKQDNPVNPADNLAKMIIGKWIAADENGQPLPTNEKKVYTFVSTTKAYVSASLNQREDVGVWLNNVEADVVIKGNEMSLIYTADESATTLEEFIVTDIDNTELIAKHKLTVIIDGNVVDKTENVVRLTKVNRDYSEAILGTWEGHVTNSEGSEFDDGETHRWEYKADGTYVYYVKDGDDWVPSANDLNEYFVDGILLATRWIDNDVENREWWEIASIKDGVMKWKGLRQKEDGTTYTATFEMKKVE